MSETREIFLELDELFLNAPTALSVPTFVPGTTYASTVAAPARPAAASVQDLGGRIFGLYAGIFRDKLKYYSETKGLYLGKEFFIVAGFNGTDALQCGVARTIEADPDLATVFFAARAKLISVDESAEQRPLHTGYTSDGLAVMAEFARIVTEDPRYHLTPTFFTKDGEVRDDDSAFAAGEVAILILHGVVVDTAIAEAGGAPSTISALLPAASPKRAAVDDPDAF
jgi:hypothetical protein